MEKNIFNYKGSSMIPFIKPKSKLLMEIIKEEQYKQGDIICFIQPPHQLFAHRLICFASVNAIKGVIEKGDNVYGYSFIPFDKIIGRISSIQYNDYSINLLSPYWRFSNFILSKIAYFQILLLKLIPYSYHKDSIYRRIPHYLCKLFFRFFLYSFLLIYKIFVVFCKHFTEKFEK